MITAGLDIGHQSINGLILDDQGIVSHLSLNIVGEVKTSAQTAFSRLLEETKLGPENIDRLVATGIGREKVSFADGNFTEMLCHLQQMLDYPQECISL